MLENEAREFNTEAMPETTQQVVPPREAKKKNRKWLKITAIVLACVLVCVAAGYAGEALSEKIEQSGFIRQLPIRDKLSGLLPFGTEQNKEDKEEQTNPEEEAAPGLTGETVGLQVGSRPDSTVNIAQIDTSRLLSAAEVYALNVRSTVGITVGLTVNYWGYTTTSAASGSGFIISDTGYILTNYHVIEDADSVTVTDYDGISYDARIAGYDESNDIAVLKIEAEGLQPVILGDSDNMNVGDTVIAIGNPLGELTFSLTQGVVSALGREVTFSGGQTMDLIQTDCAINAGNSGGALFNMYGEVIGITNAKYSSDSSTSIDNIGFAIPMNTVIDVVTSIVEKGYVSRPYLGIMMQSIDSTYQAYGLPGGVAIVEVEENSPAAQAGILANDIITAVDGEDISTAEDLKKIVNAREPGDKLEFTVYRQGDVLTLTVTVGEKIQTVEEETGTQAQSGQSDDGNSWGYGEFPFDSFPSFNW